MDDAEPEVAPEPAKPKGRVVNPDLLHIDPALLDMPLAAWWQRAGAMAIDLIIIGALSLLAGPVLGLLTGLTIAALGWHKGNSAKVWQAFRWVLLLLGGVVIILSGFLLIGHPLVRTSAFNLSRLEEAPKLETVYLSPSASASELRRAVSTLQEQVNVLDADNQRLRQSARGNSFVNAVTDSSSTLGLTFGWAGVYFTLFTAWLHGRTPGKLLFGTRVARLDGKSISAMDAFARNGGYAAGLATGSIGFLRLLWDPNRQAIQDKIAGTVVVTKKRIHAGTPTS